MTLGGKKLREWRDANGLSQTQAAAQIDGHVSDISLYENGQRTPTRQKALKLLQLADIKIGDWDVALDNGDSEPSEAA